MFYLINKFTVTGDADEFHRVILQVNKYMSAQPGFRWHRLYQSVTDPNVYIETAEWESQELHKQAISSDEFWGPVKEIGKHASVEPGPFRLVRERHIDEVA